MNIDTIRKLKNNARPDSGSISDLPSSVRVLTPWPHKAFSSRRPLGRTQVISAGCQDIVSRLCQGSGRGIIVTRSGFNLKHWLGMKINCYLNQPSCNGFKLVGSFQCLCGDWTNARFMMVKKRDLSSSPKPSNRYWEYRAPPSCQILNHCVD